MSADIVQFRFPHADIEFLEARGLRPNEVARARLEGLVRSLRVREQVERIQRHPIDRPFDPAKAVREAREEH